MTNRATRSELAQALAKAVAYRDCGKPAQAAAWAAHRQDGGCDRTNCCGGY